MTVFSTSAGGAWSLVVPHEPFNEHGVPSGRVFSTVRYVTSNLILVDNTRQNRTDTEDEEPLFGGTPFRDAHANTTDAFESSARSYYSLLNVDEDASETQIRDAYKTLAMAFHPDKHPDPHNKELAEEAFRDIHKAYQVLSDPEQRSVYDHFGEEGLQSSWALAAPGRSPAEMRAEFERQSRLRQAADAESLVNSHGEFSAVINASPLFVRNARIVSPLNPAIQTRLTLAKRLALVSCPQIVGEHGFDIPLTQSSTLAVSGQLIKNGQMGAGNLIGTLKTHWNPRFYSEINASLLQPQTLTVRGQYMVDPNLIFNWIIASQSWSVPPTVQLVWSQRLSSKSSLTGFAQVKTGAYTVGSWGADENGEPLTDDMSALVVGVTKPHEDGTEWTCHYQFTNDLSIHYEWSMKVLSGMRVKSGVSCGLLSGLAAYSNSERRVTENIRVLLGVKCGTSSGISLKIRVTRLGQRIVFPIVLSPKFRVDLAMGAAILPALAIAGSHYFYFMPKRRLATSERLHSIRKDRMTDIEQRRTSAEQTCALLRPQATKRAEAEYGRSGLVILQAYYGRHDVFPPPMDLDIHMLADKEQLFSMLSQYEALHQVKDNNQPLWCNVRVQLQMLVNQSQLVIPAGRSKSKLLGFFDPCVGERKQLYIRYLFRGRLHELTAHDDDAVAAPLRSQQIT